MLWNGSSVYLRIQEQINDLNVTLLKMSTIHYDRSKSNTSAERLKDFTSCEDDTMRYLETEGVPGIGKETKKAFDLQGIESAKDLITKFNRFKRATRTHEDVAERFFQFLRLDVGGTANMHTMRSNRNLRQRS